MPDQGVTESRERKEGLKAGNKREEQETQGKVTKKDIKGEADMEVPVTARVLKARENMIVRVARNKKKRGGSMNRGVEIAPHIHPQ